jgi:hypothetical protein
MFTLRDKKKPAKTVTVENLVERGYTTEQTRAIHERYVEGEPVDALILELGIDVTKTKFSQLFHRLQVDLQCKHCNVAMYEDLPAKSNKYPDSRYCGQCAHIDNPRCTCKGCKEEHSAHLVQSFYSALSWSSSSPVTLDELGLRDRLALYSLLKWSLEGELIAPLAESPDSAAPPLSPTFYASQVLIKEMLSKRIIMPVPKRNIESSIRIKPDKVEVSYEYFHWFPVVATNKDCGSFLDATVLLADHLDPWFDKLRTDASPDQMRELSLVIRSIAANEAWRVVTDLSQSLGFDAAQYGGKLEQLIDQCSLKFTPGRFHYFCQKSVRDAYLAYKEGRSNGLKHAINMVPFHMERLLLRCEADNWEVRPYGEPRLKCRLEQLVDQVLNGNINVGYTLTTHSPLEIEHRCTRLGLFGDKPH